MHDLSHLISTLNNSTHYNIYISICYLYFIGRQYNVRAGHVAVSGPRNFGFEALIISRTPSEDTEKEEKDDKDKTKDKKGKKKAADKTKPYTFNLPIDLIMNLRVALAKITRNAPLPMDEDEDDSE